MRGAASTAENGSVMVSLAYCELTYSQACAIIGLPPRSRHRTNELRAIYRYGRTWRLTG
jgi:hypothetical protein